MKRAAGTSPYATSSWRKAKAVLKKKHSRCQVCNVKRKRMHGHHVKGIANDPEHTTLLLICPTCHDVLTKLAARRATPLTQRQVVELWRLARERMRWP